MDKNTARIDDELKGLGYETYLFDSPVGLVVSFGYKVETGSYQGQKVTLGICMQGIEPYPEYPPHWLHISPPINDGKGGATVEYSDPKGRSWIGLSRPPGDLWDQLSIRHMQSYLTEHLRRFWNDL